MKLTINAFRRIKKIELEISDTITLIAGKIEQGKTSLLQAIGAATAQVSIFDVLSLTQKQALLLLHTGQPKATVIAEASDGMSGISFPDGKKVSEGNPPEISVWGSGLKHILDEPVKTRPEIMSKILKSEPTQEKLFAELGKITSSQEGKDRLWKTIQVQGWDAAWNQAKETNTKLKGIWEETTGERYGSKKAEEWVPSAWDFDLTNANEDDLRAKLQEEKDWLRIAETSDIIDQIDTAKIEDAKKRLPELEKTLLEHESVLQKLRTAYQNHKTAINNLPEAKQPTIQKCPNCSADLAIIDGKIQKHETIEEEVLRQRKKELDDINKSLGIVDKEIEKTTTSMIDVRAAISECKKTIDGSTEEKPSSTETPKDTVERCREFVNKAEERLNAFLAKKKADETAGKIKINQKIVDLLAPNGLRLETLESKVSEFNKILAEISQISRWGEFYLNQDMTVNHRGWPYPHLISGSAQWRVRLAMQIAISMYVEDKFILIDGADILDSEARNSLIKLLIRLKLKAVVAMTVDSKEKIPNLEKIGGKSYWVEDGCCEKV